MIGENGEQLGVVPLEEAQKRALEKELDLVEVAPEAAPPVCRIMDYGKYRYEQEKREQEARRKMHVYHIKEIRLKPNIEEHDYQVKLRSLQKFLKQGDKVKVSLFYRRRELSHPELGRNLMDRFLKDANQFGELEKPPLIEGRNIIAVVTPKH